MRTLPVSGKKERKDEFLTEEGSVISSVPPLPLSAVSNYDNFDDTNNQVIIPQQITHGAETMKSKLVSMLEVDLKYSIQPAVSHPAMEA